MKDHKISVHDEKDPFGCNLCDYSCRQRGNLNRHMITAHTDKTPFECEKCDAKYKFKSALEYHLKAFHEVTIDEDIEGPVQCYRCAEIFENVLLVKEHLSAKHGICRKSHYGKPRPHQCDACKFMFENEERKAHSDQKSIISSGKSAILGHPKKNFRLFFNNNKLKSNS